jgi:hypothetical protein
MARPAVRRDDASLLRLSRRVTAGCVVAMMLSAFVVSRFGTAIAEISWVRLHDSTFSRTVRRMYGGAKGLVVGY